MVNKRDRVLSLLTSGGTPDYVPAAFFLHFDQAYHRGQAAVDKHLAFFRYTDMDFVKIQFEAPFPPRRDILAAADWHKMPVYGPDFFAGQLAAVKGLVAAAKGEALIVQTLYSPFMLAMQTTRQPDGVNSRFVEQLSSNPEQAKRGLEVLTESLMGFVNACIELGVDGFYASTQGGEAERFADRTLFERYIKPVDLQVMHEIDARCPFNILHVCDYHARYDDLTPYLDYPGQVVNCGLQLVDGELTAQQVADLFGRPFMGGLERQGVIAQGSVEQVQQAARACLAVAPERSILAADCTVPSGTSWDNLKAAIAVAHKGRG
jgi:uroporphyrinogen decarboxylase